MNESGDDPADVPRRRRRTRRRSSSLRKQRWIISAVVFLTVMAALAFFFKEPLKRRWLAHQTSSQVSVARALMERKEWEQASSVLVEALRIAPEDAEVLRTFAALLKQAQVNPAEQIQLLQRLVDRGLATSADLTDLAGAHLRRGDLAAARRTLDALPAEARTTSEARMMEAALLKKQGRTEEADALLRQVLESQTASDPEARFKLAVLDFQQPHPTTRDRGARTLWEHARAGDAHADTAIRLLATLPTLTPESAAELARLAETRSDVVRHAALLPLLRLRPEQRDLIYNQEHARASSAGEDGLVSFTRWLALLGENDRLMKYMPDETIIKTKNLPPELLRVKLAALARLNEWDEVRQHVTPAQEKQLGTVSYHLWLARLQAHEPDGTQSARQHLDIAIEASGRGANTAIALEAVAIAAQMQDWSYAASLCQAAASHAASAPAKVTLLEKAHQFHTRAGDCSAMLITAREIATLTPGNHAHAFRADYLALLAGESFEVISARLSASAAPQDGEQQTRWRLLQALSAFRLGHSPPRDLLPADLTTAATWEPGHRAVLAALLAESGQTAEAFQLSERIQPASLLREEERLLRRAR